jgi:hypothetical protein
MTEISSPIPTTGLLPNNYQEVLSWKVTGKPIRVIALNILGLFFFVIFGNCSAMYFPVSARGDLSLRSGTKPALLAQVAFRQLRNASPDVNVGAGLAKDKTG